jgi:protein TorT
MSGGKYFSKMTGYLSRVCLLFLVVGANFAFADRAAPSLATDYVPIPVQFIYPPLKPNGSADDALASGQVRNEKFAMAAPASKPWRIAFLFPHLKDPYWVGCNYGLISEAERLSVAVQVFTSGGYDDLVGQLRQMDEAIAAKFDAIVLSPLSLTANNASIAKARAAGIPVFELANDSTSDDLTIKVTTSLKGMGVEAMQWAIRDARKRGLKSINVALLPGPEGAGWVKGEVDGSREAAAAAPIKVNIVDVRYGDSDRIIQSQLAAQLLAQHGKTLDYLLGCTGCAPAAVLPVREAGLSGKLRIVAYDLTREIAGLVRTGDIVAAVDTKGVSQARVAIGSAVNYLEGRIPKVPHTILVKLGLVDASNLAAYPFDTSTAPDGFKPNLSYIPPNLRKSF